MSLYTKIHAVMCESESLEKNLTVGKPGSENSYKAVGEAEVLNTIKPLFKKHGLIILPVEGKIIEVNGTVETEYNGIKKVTARNIAQLTCYYKIIDTETGEFEQVVGFGFGADSQDKGSGKACTYALKTVLQKTFLLFSGEDTDNDHSDDIGKTKPPAKQTPKPEVKANLVTGYIPSAQPKPAEAKQTPAPAVQTPSEGKPDAPEVKAEAVNPVSGYICENCTKPVTDVKAKDGKIYTAHAIAMKSQREYGCILCFDCAVKAKKSADEVAKEIAKVEMSSAINRIKGLVETK